MFHHFVVRLNKINRQNLINLFKKGIQILVHYEKPLFMQKALIGKKEIKNAYKVSKNIISLPIYPSLKDKLKKICSELNKWHRKILTRKQFDKLRTKKLNLMQKNKSLFKQSIN